ncbi:Protein CBG25921 [Caenorhabditis briggsae]|uniref:Protein CBG25921 n=1 Tax=Caenorhabditis briggsae TaxID=6238 RepID=B6IK53_CAEBR|nr:Protein CBG25921 [Caenorhabditis briggsae]CAS00283.1 Protein CBG25921 [Caenorhabditis briggsae]
MPGPHRANFHNYTMLYQHIFSNKTGFSGNRMKDVFCFVRHSIFATLANDII